MVTADTVGGKVGQVGHWCILQDPGRTTLNYTFGPSTEQMWVPVLPRVLGASSLQMTQVLFFYSSNCFQITAAEGSGAFGPWECRAREGRFYMLDLLFNSSVSVFS